ncbi:MAG TPA: response regulator transcription factor [Scandinavium sp.]|jgi:DNA-binding NarL/FixJ family response regulator|uniref:response regulator transcription factor n=1 Tax=Scandinavium sp. TaxID=2830653 RepID=UPI002E34F75E|nr:response regulator transcription factor [Scandinavium sp.]HEX4499625.1 response regulator transcription factor [Scandinavium sp.]
MLAACLNYGVIISDVPIILKGLSTLIKDNFPEYEVSYHQDIDELTIMQLCRTNLIVVDLSGEGLQAKELCEKYYSLMANYKDSRWIFMLSHNNYPLAVEYLLRPESTLLSYAEPVSHIITAIREQSSQTNRISASLTTFDAHQAHTLAPIKSGLSLSERQVLRLFAKGWGVNQIAMLLRKSNKTISAQKNSAMRRLTLRGNAELYAWLNSDVGMKELNLLPVEGEPKQWKNTSQVDTSLSLKTV